MRMGLVLALAVACCGLVSCQGRECVLWQSHCRRVPEMPVIVSAQAVKAAQDSGAVIVLAPREWPDSPAVDVIPRAVDAFGLEDLEWLRERNVIVYGRLSKPWAAKLYRATGTKAAIFTGGIEAWKEAGYEVYRDPIWSVPTIQVDTGLL